MTYLTTFLLLAAVLMVRSTPPSLSFEYSDDTMFECTNDAIHCENKYGDCIPSYWNCDDVADCKYGEDEQDCHSSSSSQYRDDMFECTDDAIHCENKHGDCIPEYFRCDDIVDCYDGQDEVGCDENKKKRVRIHQGSQGRARGRGNN
ncbi:low-density lipoprotein receptor-like [Acanthaster planci]|uniref:Low-density lipoprotein receptor-like n=1 Tax=Acanthaster planci TaxID=133434 RepID=A0A8B7Z877_ACAPL|nr:low-density lipoprotein receptor-like [Acanthaster planci]